MDIAAKLAKLDAEANRRSAEIVTVNALIATPAQPLMVIVPDSGDGGGDGKEGAGTTAEVMIANQDIGFVNPGQMAEVKLETFPHTRYGTLKARVAIVTSDAVGEDRRGAEGSGSGG